MRAPSVDPCFHHQEPSMFEFLKSLIGGGPEAPAALDKTDANEVMLDLRCLERVDPGLAKRAIAYVLGGEGGSVLLEFEQRKDAVAPILNPYHQQNRDSDGV